MFVQYQEFLYQQQSIKMVMLALLGTVLQKGCQVRNGKFEPHPQADQECCTAW